MKKITTKKGDELVRIQLIKHSDFFELIEKLIKIHQQKNKSKVDMIKLIIQLYPEKIKTWIFIAKEREHYLKNKFQLNDQEANYLVDFIKNKLNAEPKQGDKVLVRHNNIPGVWYIATLEEYTPKAELKYWTYCKKEKAMTNWHECLILY